jgi:hypothetical protein
MDIVLRTTVDQYKADVYSIERDVERFRLRALRYRVVHNLSTFLRATAERVGHAVKAWYFDACSASKTNASRAPMRQALATSTVRTNKAFSRTAIIIFHSPLATSLGAVSCASRGDGNLGRRGRATFVLL